MRFLNLKRLICLVCALAMSLCIVTFPAEESYAADEVTTQADDVVLQVYLESDMNNPVGFTKAELEEIQEAEGNKLYSYSGYNTYPTYEKIESAQGPTIEGVLSQAADISGKNAYSLLEDDMIVEFVGTDSYSVSFTKEKLFADRYYYPNATLGGYSTGNPVTEESMDGAVLVPAIIELDVNHGRLVIGQVLPNEQTKPMYCQNLARRYEKKSAEGEIIGVSTGKIIIHNQTNATECEQVKSVTGYQDGETIPVGTEINFKDPYGGSVQCWTYYTDDGTEPTAGSTCYNYGMYRGEVRPYEIKPGKNTVKVRSYAYEKKNSEEYTTFIFYGSPGIPKATASRASYSSVKVSWPAVSGAEYYNVYRYNGKSYVKVATVKGTSWTNSGLNIGQRYYYRVTSYGKSVESKQSATVSAVPAVAPPSLKLSAGKKRATVRWSKVSGASGYRVYRSTNARSGFKCVKVIKKQRTVSYVNKRLKKKKVYYYKVQAYRTVKGKKYYGPFSPVKSVRTR